MTSIIGGVFVSLVVGGLGADRVPVAVAAMLGVLVAAATIAVLWRDQARRWRTTELSVASALPVRT